MEPDFIVTPLYNPLAFDVRFPFVVKVRGSCLGTTAHQKLLVYQDSADSTLQCVVYNDKVYNLKDGSSNYDVRGKLSDGKRNRAYSSQTTFRSYRCMLAVGGSTELSAFQSYLPLRDASGNLVDTGLTFTPAGLTVTALFGASPTTYLAFPDYAGIDPLSSGLPNPATLSRYSLNITNPSSYMSLLLDDEYVYAIPAALTQAETHSQTNIWLRYLSSPLASKAIYSASTYAIIPTPVGNFVDCISGQRVDFCTGNSTSGYQCMDTDAASYNLVPIELPVYKRVTVVTAPTTTTPTTSTGTTSSTSASTTDNTYDAPYNSILSVLTISVVISGAVAMAFKLLNP